MEFVCRLPLALIEMKLKKNVLFIFVLFFSILSYAQPLHGIRNCEMDSSRFYIDSDGIYLVLKILIDSNWTDNYIVDEAFDYFELNCELIDFNGIGSDELVLNWKTSTYGTGGGSIFGGVQIWNLDNGVKIFDELNYHLQENFGRGEAIPWLISCEKKINITTNQIVVDTMTCKEEWNKSNMTAKELIGDESYYFTKLEGCYKYQDGILKK